MKIYSKRLLLLVVLISSLYFPVLNRHAEGAESYAAVTSNKNMPLPDQEEKTFSNPAHMFPLAEEVSGLKLQNQLQEYLDKRDWKLGFSKKGTYLGWGEAEINVPPDDLRFGQARIIAFEKAFADAKGEYAQTSQRRTTTQTVRQLFHDDREPSPADLVDEKSRLKLIYEKVEALTEAKLDEKLEEAGVDPKELQNKSVKKKQKMAADAISRTIATRSIQSVAGVRVLATFEDLEGVGVLIVCSDQMRQIAKAVADGKTVGHPSKKDPKESILEQIEAKAPKDVDLAFMHGVRVMIDENGDRALVSFGQSSPKITKNDSKMKKNMAIKAAREQAYALADGDLTDFIKSTVVLDQKTNIEGSDTMERLIRSDSSVEDTESNQIGSSLNKLIRQKGHATLQGTTTVKRWTANHPETGHLIVGHILMWSPATRDAAANKAERGYASSEGGQSKTRKYQNKVRQSADFDEDADF